MILSISFNCIRHGSFSLKMHQKRSIFISTCTMIISIIVGVSLFVLKPIFSSWSFFFEAVAPVIVLIIILTGGDVAGLVVLIDVALLELIGICVFVVVIFLDHQLDLMLLAGNAVVLMQRHSSI